MQMRTVFAASLVLFPLLSATARADVMPPEAEAAGERMQKDPKALDRADSYCADKAIGAACLIPGNVFEGGGAGKCERRIDHEAFTIDLRCNLPAWPEIERGLPSGPYQIDESACRSLAADPQQKETLKGQGMVCDAVPTVADRFCAGRSAGAACNAEMRVAEQRESHAGVCHEVKEGMLLYYEGRREATRSVLQCDPAKSTPEPVIKPIGLWRKLFG